MSDSRQLCYKILAVAADFVENEAATAIFLEKSGCQPPIKCEGIFLHIAIIRSIVYLRNYLEYLVNK